MRNPRRTAATASALMIGLALVGTIGVLTASTNASLDRIIDRAIGADYVVLDNNSFASFSPAVANSLEEVPGVASVTRERFGPGQVDGQQVVVTAIDPGGIGTALNVDQVAGDLGALGDNTLLINEPTAIDNGYAVGDTVTLTLPNGSLDLRVAGIFERSDALEGYTISLGAWEQAGGAPQDSFLYVSAEEGANQGQVRSGLEAALADYPVVTLQDQTEFKQAQRDSIGQLTTVIYALLALSILIAVLGIINTLALSVIERTREIGLLRAVGLSRRQLRQMIRLESVVISVFGALLGLVIGVGFAAALQRSLANNGIEVLQIPYGQLLVFLVLAAVIGVLAAVFPARRAAKLDVLRAITTE
jgi:putative ABC transport system permease protein